MKFRPDVQSPTIGRNRCGNPQRYIVLRIAKEESASNRSREPKKPRTVFCNGTHIRIGKAEYANFV